MKNRGCHQHKRSLSLTYHTTSTGSRPTSAAPDAVAVTGSGGSTGAVALREWLHQELEMRGIDGLVYARYILTLLHRQDLPDQDAIESELFSLWQPMHVERPHTAGPFRALCGPEACSAEAWKRAAAVDCLTSASEQENCSDIESLVEEVCQKLKAITSECVSAGKDKLKGKQRPKSETLQVVEDRSRVPRESPLLTSSPERRAERYYAAFPALSDDVNEHMASDSKSPVLQKSSQPGPSKSPWGRSAKDVNRLHVSNSRCATAVSTSSSTESSISATNSAASPGACARGQHMHDKGVQKENIPVVFRRIGNNQAHPAADASSSNTTQPSSAKRYKSSASQPIRFKRRAGAQGGEWSRGGSVPNYGRHHHNRGHHGGASSQKNSRAKSWPHQLGSSAPSCFSTNANLVTEGFDSAACSRDLKNLLKVGPGGGAGPVVVVAVSKNARGVG